MPQFKGSYYGKTITPQYQTYPTAGLLKPKPLPSVTPIVSPTKPSNDGGYSGPLPPNPDMSGPLVGAPAPSVPAINTTYDNGGVPAPTVDQTPRQKLATAIMNRGMADQ